MESFSSTQCMVVYSGVDSSLHPRFHHQIVFAKFDLTLHYLLPYKRRVWDYEYASTAQIKNALASFNWEKALSNSSIEKKISVLNEAGINVMSNYIPNETKVFDGQRPPWMNVENEILITAKNEDFKKHLKRIRNCYYTYK